MGDNTHARHNDSRAEELRERYGDLADRNVQELQQMARDQGIKNASSMGKEDLLETLA
jgi:hypothetical protein